MSMQRFVIEGGKKLTGTVDISGAKNSALPIIAASILTDKKVILENVPDLVDVRTMIELIEYLGANVEFNRNTLRIHTPRIRKIEAPYDIVRKMRASYYALGALVARENRARVSFPGGCAIGPRPIDLHIKGLQALGTNIDIEDGYINAHVRKLRGQEVHIQGPKGTSVGATINVMIAAARARGITKISPAACEPEVVDVANFLNTIGCSVSGQGTHTKQQHLKSVLDKLEEIGVQIKTNMNETEVTGKQEMHATDIFVAPYPGFPTDMQSQFMALLSIVSGTSTIKETIFENRFMQAIELMRMGAKITIEGDTAVIKGVKRLSGATLMASDLRASAALVLAGLVAKGKTVVRRIYHLDRGYEKFEHKLRSLGVRIKRQTE